MKDVYIAFWDCCLPVCLNGHLRSGGLQPQQLLKEPATSRSQGWVVVTGRGG